MSVYTYYTAYSDMIREHCVVTLRKYNDDKKLY